MILTLQVTGPEAASIASANRHVFSVEGGVIGRAKSSDWVLPHAKVSGRHAVISFLDGVFYIEDTSTNGVFINSRNNRLVAGRRYALQNGDRILIDPYQIDVSVAAGDGAPANPFGIEDALRPAAAPVRPVQVVPGPHEEPQPVPADEVDPLKLIGGQSPRAPARSGPTAEELHHRSVMSDHYQPPAIVTPAAKPADPRVPAPPPGTPFAIPADYDPLRDDFMGPEPVPPAPVPIAPPSAPPAPAAPVAAAPVFVSPAPVAPSAAVYSEETIFLAPPAESPAVAASPQVAPGPVAAAREAYAPVEAPPAVAAPVLDAAAAVADLLAGAGLENVQATPDLARTFGEIFRVVVSGVMDVLQSRQQVKDEFRMRMTQFRPADNNPLKFSANVDDALHNLLIKRNPAYLGPVDAFEDAFEDLRNHQLAMLAGMRVAFESLLREFDPDRLQHLFDRQLKRTPMLRPVARMRYWDLYRDRRDEMAKDPDGTFKRLFGEEFARAYEEQLNRLKAEGRARAERNRSGDA